MVRKIVGTHMVITGTLFICSLLLGLSIGWADIKYKPGIYGIYIQIVITLGYLIAAFAYPIYAGIW